MVWGQGEEWVLKSKVQNIKHKIMVISNKGGVGKSTVALNLAYGLAEKFKVGLLDVDLHGPNMAKMLGIEGQRLRSRGETLIPIEVSPNLKAMTIASILESPDSPIIWRGPLKMKAIKQFLEETDWGELDYLIIDSPPGTGDEPLSVAQLIPDMDGVIVVTTPQDLALLDSRKAVNFARELKVPVLGIIENMSGLICPHCGKEIDLFKKGGGEKAAQELGVPFLGRIPIEPSMVDSGDEGKPFIVEYKKSETAKIFEDITKLIIGGRN